jgi:hypothetical protein
MVTLAVTLEQANILQVVQGRGEISLAARSPDDTLAGATRPDKLTLYKLLGIEPPPEPPPPFTMEVFRGGNLRVRRFDRRRVELENYGTSAAPGGADGAGLPSRPNQGRGQSLAGTQR